MVTPGWYEHERPESEALILEGGLQPKDAEYQRTIRSVKVEDHNNNVMRDYLARALAVMQFVAPAAPGESASYTWADVLTTARLLMELEGVLA